jgi:hypothetical protein
LALGDAQRAPQCFHGEPRTGLLVIEQCQPTQGLGKSALEVVAEGQTCTFRKQLRAHEQVAAKFVQ